MAYRLSLCVRARIKCDAACAVCESGESAERASGAARVLQGSTGFSRHSCTQGVAELVQAQTNAWHSDVVMMGIRV